MKRILAVFLLTIFIVSALAVNGQAPARISQTVQQRQWESDTPDLTLTSEDITFSPTSPTAGDTVTITATIHNIGDSSVRRVKVAFYLGEPATGKLIDTATIRRIRAGRSRDASAEWTTRDGTHDIYVVADPDDTISESNADNNVASKPITVGTTPPPAVVHDVAVISVTPSPTEVTAGEVVTITVVVENQGTETETFDVYIYADQDTAIIGDEIIIDSITGVSLEAEASTTLGVTWDTTGIVEGAYTISAEVPSVSGEEDTADNTLTDGIVTVSAPGGAPPTATHELFIEIDYMEGHTPTQQVLDYIEWYYMGNNPSSELINVTFYVDDEVPLDPSISDTDFWDIEAAYNDLGDDAYGAGDAVFGTAGVYSSNWKWVLYGTTVEGYPNVVGYTYVVIARIGWRTYDLLAGNYVFIADETADDWATNNGIEPYGAEAVVLMHEMGHSIGIAKLDRRGREVYDRDKYSVMSYLSTANAGLYWAWYYSDDYWATRNIEYYAV